MIPTNAVEAAYADLPLAIELLKATGGEQSKRHSRVRDHKETDDLIIGAADLAAAYRLAVALSSIGTSMAQIVTSGKLVILEIGDETGAELHELLSMGVRLCDHIVDYGYTTGSAQDLVQLGPWPVVREFHNSALESAMRDKTMFAYVAPKADPHMPPALRLGADLIAPVPPLTGDGLARIFRIMTGAIPARFGMLEHPDRVSMEVLGSILRKGRSPDACLDALLSAIPGDAKAADKVSGLETAFGFGEAKVWGLDLVEDYKAWKAGKLGWADFPNRSLLLSGAPGTGKSTFPKLLASSLGVPLHATSVASWNATKYLSGTLSAMSEAFKAVTMEGGLLFIDEIDGIGNRDTVQDYKAYWDQVINHLLQLVADALLVPGVIIVAATNYPDGIDPALLRSGRLGKRIHIKRPEANDRGDIIRGYFGQPISTADLEQLVAATEDMSGADIEVLVRDGKARARRRGETFSARHIVEVAMSSLEDLAPPQRRRIAIYETGRTIVAQILDAKLGQLGRFPTLVDLRDQLAILLAGRMAEEILLGHASTFGETDLEAATKLAMRIEGNLGMGSSGLVHGRAIVRHSIDVAAVRGQIESAAERASRILTDNRAEIERRVLKFGSMRGVVRIWDGDSMTRH